MSKVIRLEVLTEIHCAAISNRDFGPGGDTCTLEVPSGYTITCDCAVADDAVMPIRAKSSS